MARPKKYNISLTDDELKELKSVMRKKQTTKTVRNRCQIIIDLDEAHGKVLTHAQSAKTNCVCMATIMNTVKLYSEKGIQGIRTMNRNVNSDMHAENLMGVLRLVLLKLRAVLHRKDIPAGHSVCWKNRQKLYLMFQSVKIPSAGL